MIDQKENPQNGINEYQKIDSTVSNNVWDSSKILDRMLLFGIISLSLLLILKVILTPINGDDWQYGTTGSISGLFYFGGGETHPGRHISELLHVIPTQIFGKMLGIVIGNAVLANRIISIIVMTGIFYLFFWVSSSYIIKRITISEKQNTLIKYFIILLLFYFSNGYYTMTMVSQVTGGYMLALLVWMPFLYFYQNSRLPLWMTNNKFQTYGIMLVVYYLGTQVIDTGYFITVSLSMMLAAYIVGQKLLPDFFEKTKISNEDQNFILSLLGMHIFYGCYAFFRNVVDTVQINYRTPSVSFDIIEIINRIKVGPWLQNISIIVGGIIILYYIYKIIKNKFIKKEDYLYISMCVVALFWLVILAVVDTRIDHPIWFLWLCEINIIFKLYKSKNKIVLLLLPIVLLGIFVNVFQRERVNLNKSIEYYQRDKILANLFIDAQINNKQTVEIPVDLVEKFELPPETSWHTTRIPIWMKYHGYTDRIIPITFSSNQ